MSYEINHQIGVKASPEEIYKTLTETEKLAQWWTTDTRGNGAKVGDTLEFHFYGACQRFNVKGLEPGKRVAWKSPKGQGADEWEETEVSFDLSTDETSEVMRLPNCHVLAQSSRSKSALTEKPNFLERIKPRISALTSGLPGRRRDFRVQYQANALRCQSMTVAGCTIRRQGRQPDQNRDNRTHNAVGALEAQVTGRVFLENRKLVPKREDLRLQGSTGSKTGG